MKSNTLVLVGVALIAVVIGVFVFLSSNDDLQDISLTTANTQTSAVIVPITKLMQGKQSTIATRVNYFITSSDQLSSLWKMIDAAGTPPAIDFETQAVIAVFAGKEPTSSIAVAKVEDTDARLVSIALAKLDGNCASTQQSAIPYEIVVVPTTSLPLAHKDIVTTASCTD